MVFWAQSAVASASITSQLAWIGNFLEFEHAESEQVARVVAR